MKSIKQNVRDEKTGKNKEKIHTQPTIVKIFNKAEVMVKKYEDNGNPPQAIKGRVMIPTCRKRFYRY